MVLQSIRELLFNLFINSIPANYGNNFGVNLWLAQSILVYMEIGIFNRSPRGPWMQSTCSISDCTKFKQEKHNKKTSIQSPRISKFV